MLSAGGSQRRFSAAALRKGYKEMCSSPKHTAINLVQDIEISENANTGLQIIIIIMSEPTDIRPCPTGKLMTEHTVCPTVLNMECRHVSQL